MDGEFGALSSPTGMPNFAPIRSEMKALQLFFVFLHGYVQTIQTAVGCFTQITALSEWGIVGGRGGNE